MTVSAVCAQRCSAHLAVASCFQGLVQEQQGSIVEYRASGTVEEPIRHLPARATTNRCRSGRLMPGELHACAAMVRPCWRCGSLPLAYGLFALLSSEMRYHTMACMHACMQACTGNGTSMQASAVLTEALPGCRTDCTHAVLTSGRCALC